MVQRRHLSDLDHGNLCSAVLLGAYWVANFLVPDLVSKYFSFEKVGKEDDQNKPEEDDSTREGRSRSQTKGRGFDSTKS